VGTASRAARSRPKRATSSATIAQPRAANATFTPLEIATLYEFPAGTDGKGQCIGIIELGGGYRRTDLKAYFKQLGIALPKVSSKSVDGAKNKPTGDINSADGEVVLDIEVAGAVAPTLVQISIGP